MTKLNKKELKDHINKNGFFARALIVKPKSDMTEAEMEAYMPAAVKSKVPEGAMYFKAIASNGELNRNGYIIREKAWKGAVDGYMENPVLLLGHDMDQPIGQVLTAHVGQEGLVISGFVYDDLTNNRFSKNLFNAVSTGHLNKVIEFENSATGEILTEEEFRRLNWEERSNGNWIMAVVELDWLENSIVSIGANRKSLVKNRDLVKNYIEALKNETDEDGDEEEKATPEVKAEDKAETETPAPAEQPKEEEKKEEPEKTEQPKTEVKQDEAEKGEVETPAAPEKAENAPNQAVAETVMMSVAEVNEARAALEEFATLTNKQKLLIDKLTNEISVLNAKLNNTPVRKGLVVTNGSPIAPAPKPKSAIGALLEANGIAIND